MPYSALYQHPNAAERFSVTDDFFSVVSSIQAFQPMGRTWHGNGKLQPRRFDWSPRPQKKLLRAWPIPADPILASSILSGNLPGRLHATSFNRRRPDCRVTASQIRENLA
ncbi:hypothetical protein [Pseudogemmobacter bohemicus]|uniref:hypothetical protein n=1 Tax=Pseudogemmobacter bohemicus TaxID=2250708 RepID=UPI001300BCB3|nr:hypothetical protein [Pseudogemmobacter bohemicus]